MDENPDGLDPHAYVYGATPLDAVGLPPKLKDTPLHLVELLPAFGTGQLITSFTNKLVEGISDCAHDALFHCTCMSAPPTLSP